MANGLLRSMNMLAIAALLSLCSLGGLASAQLLAVDLGSEYLKVSLIKPGRTPISIVVNEMTRRKSPALVGVVGGQRLLGEEAFSLAVRHPDSIYTRVRDLLGRQASDPGLHQLLQTQSLPYKVVPHSAERPTAAAQGKDGAVHSAEELAASLLQYAQGIAEAQSGGPVPDAVVVVPPFFGQAQRQALVEAAQLAGINLMGIINSNTAAALQYGIEKDFAGKTQHVVLYDMGSGSTVASLVKYSSYEVKEAGKPKAISQLEVKEVEWDEQCGANNLDALLAQHFAADFASKNKLKVEDVVGNPRTMAKMRKQVRRTKEILSANTAAPLSVEELHDGIDYQSSITRDDFEKLAGPFFQQAARPLQAILDRSGLALNEIDHVEIIGGGSRIPRVQTVLQDVLKGRLLDKHMDADESVVLGASLFAANLSTSFRLRKFGMADAAMYGVSLRFDELHKPAQLGAAAPAPEDAEEKERNLLPYMKKLPVRRVVNFSNLTRDPIRLCLSYNTSTPHGVPPSTDPQHPDIGCFSVTGIDSVISKYNSSGTVHLKFEAGYDGIIRFDKAEAVVQYTVLEERIRQVKPNNSSSNTTGSSSTSSEDNNAKAEGEKAKEAADGASEDGATEESAPGDEAAEGAAGEEPKEGEEPVEGATKPEEGAAPGAQGANATDTEKHTERVTVPKTKTAKVPLNITSTFAHPSLAGEALAKARIAISSWLATERAKREDAAAKNELEAYIIKTRTAFAGDDEGLQKVSTDEQREKFVEALSAAEDWLYEEGDAEGSKVFRQKLAGLRQTGDPIKRRAEEMERRPTVLSNLRKDIDIKLSAARLFESVKPWISAEDRAEAEKKVLDFLAWLDAQEEAQSKKQPHEEPAFTVDQLLAEYDKCSKAFNKIANKKKPKPPPEPPASGQQGGKAEGEQQQQQQSGGEGKQGEEGQQQQQEGEKAEGQKQGGEQEGSKSEL